MGPKNGSRVKGGSLGVGSWISGSDDDDNGVVLQSRLPLCMVKNSTDCTVMVH